MGTFGKKEWARYFRTCAAALDLSSTQQTINWPSLVAGLQQVASRTPLTDLK